MMFKNSVMLDDFFLLTLPVPLEHEYLYAVCRSLRTTERLQFVTVSLTSGLCIQIKCRNNLNVSIRLHSPILV